MHLNKPTSRDSLLVISSFAHAWISLSNGSIGGGGGGGYSWEFLVGVCRPVLQILTLKKCRSFSHPFSDLAFKKLCHHYFDQNSNNKYFLKFISNSQISLSFLFIWNETINTFVHSPSSLENHIRFQNKMNKVNLKTRFETKTAQHRSLQGGTYPYDLYREVPPSPRGRGFAVLQAITKL